MTVQLSPSKVRRLLRDFFRGLPQELIGEKIHADQSSVSHWVSIFRTLAEDGITEASKEFTVQTEVDELRSLASELYRLDVTAPEAKNGANIIKAFLKLGVSPEQHTQLIKVCKQVGDPNFVKAAIKLVNIEHSSGLGYVETTLRFEKASKQLPEADAQLKATRKMIESANSQLAGKNQQLSDIQLRITEALKKESANEKEMENKLEAKRKNLGVKEKEVEDGAHLKKLLTAKGLDIGTLIQLSEEFQK